MAGVYKFLSRTQLNNGVLNAPKAMPQKDAVADGNNSFSMDRHNYVKYFPAYRNSLVTPAQLTNQTLVKKWIGGNRDASSIIKTKRVNALGTSLNADGKSFSLKGATNSNDVRDALTRLRGSGYAVPPKVTGRITVPLPVDNNKYYRIVAGGLVGAPGGFVGQSGSAYGVRCGIYNYTLGNTTGTQLIAGNRSYNVMTISRATGEVTVYPVYDVFGNVTNATALSNLLNSLDSSVIVIISTFDEPETNSASLTTAFRRCGASSGFNSIINYRGAYILVGVPGVGVGNGLEMYRGDTTPTGDPNAWIDLRISVLNGQYTYISG